MTAPLVGELISATEAGDTVAATALAKALRAKPKLSFADHLALAQHAVSLADHALAVMDFRAALQIKPRHIRAMLGLVDALSATGNLPEAIYIQRELCEASSAATGHRMRLAKLMRANGQKDEAAEIVRQIRGPAGDVREAVDPGTGRSLEAWFAEEIPNGSSASIRWLRALMSDDRGGLREATHGLRKLATAGDRRLEVAARALCEAARGTSAWRGLSIAVRRAAAELARLGHGEAAIAALDHLLAIEPAPDVLLQQANFYIALGSNSQAIANLDRILTADPMDLRTANALAVHCNAEQLAEIASRIAPLVLATAREFPHRRTEVVHILTRLMRFEEAKSIIGTQPLKEFEVAEAAFDLATSTFDSALARRAIAECILAPEMGSVRDAWQLRLALIEADRRTLIESFDRLTAADKFQLIEPTLQNHAAIAVGRYPEAFDFLVKRARRDEIRATMPNLYRFGEPLESLSKSHILVIGYTAVGDEIRLLDLVERARPSFASCTIAVDSRISGLIERRASGLTVVGIDKLSPVPMTSTIPAALRQHVDQDLWHRISTFDRVFLIRDFEPLLVRDTTDLPSPGRKLEPEPALRLHWRARLERAGPRPRVGLFWRSGKLTFRRMNRVTDLSQWSEMLETSGVTFVSLQYGARVSAEIAELGPNAKIVRYADLDTKHDLDAVAALMCELDMVVTVPSATLHLAGALGVPTLGVTHPSQMLWRTRPGTSIGTWSPNVEMITGPSDQGFAGAIASASERVRQIFGGRLPSEAALRTRLLGATD